MQTPGVLGMENEAVHDSKGGGNGARLKRIGENSGGDLVAKI